MKQIILFQILVMFSITTYGQYSWTNYNAGNSALPNNQVRKIAEDNNGNIWAATTGGLAKFDGTNWTIYTSTPTGESLLNLYTVGFNQITGVLWCSNSSYLFSFDGTNWGLYYVNIPGSYVTEMKFDSSGLLWLMFFSKGIASFDGITLTEYNEINSPLPDNFIFKIDFAPNGDLWMATQGGVVRKSGLNWTVFDITNSALPVTIIKCIAVQQNGTVWAMSNLPGQGYLYSYDGTNWTSYDTTICVIPSPSKMDMDFDQQGRRWIGTFASDLHVFSDTSCYSFTPGNSPLPSTNINDVFIASNGTIWLGMLADGLVRIELTTSLSAPSTNDTWNVYPNPVMDDIVTISGDENLSTVRIFDMCGKLIIENENLEVTTFDMDVQNLSKGLYMIVMEDVAHNAVVRKLIIQ